VSRNALATLNLNLCPTPIVSSGETLQPPGDLNSLMIGKLGIGPTFSAARHLLQMVAGAGYAQYFAMLSYRLGEPVPAELRNAEVHGSDRTHRLGDLLRGPTLVLFLRHFG